MKSKVIMASRYIFGLGFLIFGLNGFLNFMPNPQPSPEAGELLGALFKTGYFFPMIKVIEITTGVLLLLNRFVPFALVLIAPVLVGITSIHLFLNPAGLPMMMLLHILHGIVVWGYWSYFKPVLTATAIPRS